MCKSERRNDLRQTNERNRRDATVGKNFPITEFFNTHDLFTTVDSLTRNTGMIEGKAF
jgi:hypothetical protein